MILWINQVISGIMILLIYFSIKFKFCYKWVNNRNLLITEIYIACVNVIWAICGIKIFQVRRPRRLNKWIYKRNLLITGIYLKYVDIIWVICEIKIFSSLATLETRLEAKNVTTVLVRNIDEIIGISWF